jgi:hypothetical protein
MNEVKGFGRAFYHGYGETTLGHILNETATSFLFLEDGFRTAFWTNKVYVMRLPDAQEVRHV